MADVVDIPEFRAFYYTDDTPRQFYTLRRYEDESGSGEMHCYNIAPGIQLSFNDLNLSSCYQPLNVQKDFLEINYCLEGGHEVEMVGGGITFLGEKDLSISGLYHDKRVIVNSRIPFNKYKGITILLELETAQTTLDNEFSKWHIDLQKIRTTLCPEGRVLLIKSKQKIDHIFAEILSVENQIRLPYYWLKILEILLLLSQLDNSYVEPPQQFTEKVSRRTQQVYQYIIENPFTQKNISEIAEIYGVSESSMKRCFKSISGASLGTFMKRKRMEAAAELLRSEPTLSVGEIASLAGYENQGKFSGAFKSVYAMITTGEYGLTLFKTQGGFYDPGNTIGNIDPSMAMDPIISQVAAYLPGGADLITELESTTDEERIQEIYGIILTTMADQCLTTPLVYPHQLAVYSDKIANYDFPPDANFTAVQNITLK